MERYNFWFFSSLAIALIVAMPIITVFFSFFAACTAISTSEPDASIVAWYVS